MRETLGRPRRVELKSKGFTLIELLVVMTIIAIAFFAVRPGIASIRRGAENRKALRQLVGLLTSARTKALANGRVARVMCDPEARVFWAEMQVDPFVDRDEFRVVRVLGRERMQLPRGLWLSEMAVAGQNVGDPAQNPIYFYPDGRADGASLVLMDERGWEVSLKLAAATGRVTIGG